MKSSRLILDIISIIGGLSANLVFLLPIWYFTVSSTIDDQTTTHYTLKSNFFDKSTLNDINLMYETCKHSLNLNFYYIFNVLCIITIILSILFVILTIISFLSKSNLVTKIAKISKITSILIILLSLISFICSLIFTKQNIKPIQGTYYTLSINISLGIYLFTLSSLFSGVTGYIANNLKESNYNI